MKVVLIYWVVILLILAAAVNCAIKGEWLGVFGMCMAAIIIGQASGNAFYAAIHSPARRHMGTRREG